MHIPREHTARSAPPGSFAALAGIIGWGFLASIAAGSCRRLTARYQELRCSLELHERLKATDCLPEMRTRLQVLASRKEAREKQFMRYSSKLAACWQSLGK